MTPSRPIALGVAVLFAASACKVSPSAMAGDTAIAQVPSLAAPRSSGLPSAASSANSSSAALPAKVGPSDAGRSDVACSKPSTDPQLRVVSPDGRVVVFVANDPQTVPTSVEDLPRQDLCIEIAGAAPRVLVAGRTAGPNESVEHTLAGFGNLLFSRDGGVVFFTSDAWVTSTAAHVVEVGTGRESFLFDGSVEVEVTQGPDAGRFVASHFRLDDVYPVSSPKYRGRRVTWSLVTRTGKTLRKLSEAEASRLGADVSGS